MQKSGESKKLIDAILQISDDVRIQETVERRRKNKEDKIEERIQNKKKYLLQQRRGLREFLRPFLGSILLENNHLWSIITGNFSILSPSLNTTGG